MQNNTLPAPINKDDAHTPPLEYRAPAAPVIQDEAARQQPTRIPSGTKTLLAANTAWYLFNFRGGLLRELKRQGAEVVVVSPYDDYVRNLQEEGIRWIEWKLNRASMNPLGGFRSVASLASVYRREKPDLAHHFTIKPILYGTTAAKWAGVPCIVNSVTGLGPAFLSQRLPAKLARPFIRRWYLWSLTARGVGPIFQNHDDLAELARSSSQLVERAVMTEGSGVDLSRFTAVDERSIADGAKHGPAAKKALFIGRLIYEKGIAEFVEAARICKSRQAPIRFVVCGEPDPGNPSSIDAEKMRQWRGDGAVEFLGHVDRIEEQIADVEVVVLPSYREGTPRVLLEAAAMGKPLLATDVPGCREVVEDGVTGILVPPRDASALASALQTLMGDDELRRRMGKAGRRMVAERFDERKVIAQNLNVYRQLLQKQS